MLEVAVLFIFLSWAFVQLLIYWFKREFTDECKCECDNSNKMIDNIKEYFK